ncbi:MAG TPA: DUF1570 domain-containing protein [Pirellulales bacterium]|nr:DUF1570 domain-containing protein [Pirellulales bacterium]
MMRHALSLFLLAALWTRPAAAVEHVVFRQNDEEVSVTGRLVVKAEDEGMLLLSADGTLWSVEPQNLVRHKHDDEPLKPLSSDQLAERLREEFPGFEIHTTQHYLICYNTSRAYAQWCGALFERVYKAFTNFWSRKDFVLHEPEFPLVAIVFASKESYEAQTNKHLGQIAGKAIGFYHIASNRIFTYDLTGSQALRRPGDKRGNPNEINQMLARPEAELNVATVIHEATHQIGYSCGLQARYSAIPIWLSEGMAIYFETPDLNNSKGWRTIGAVNQARLARFRAYLRSRPPDSLASLIASDDRLRNRELAEDAYAEAWALHYFLIRQRPKQYMAYIKLMSEKGALIQDDAETRIAEFQQAFGDMRQLDGEFVKQMAKVH